MNCTQGCLAQIVRAPRPSLAVYLGSIVRCERFIGPMDGLDEFTRQPTTTKAAWECTALSPRLDDFGIWRALWLCIAFDALLALLIWGVWACAH